MDAGATLQTLAEVSIALAGFSAIAIALRAPQVGGFHSPGNRWGLALLFSFALGAFFFSLLPAVLAAAGAGEALVWSVANALLAVYFVIDVGIFGIAFRRLPSGDRPPIRTTDWSYGGGITLVTVILLLFNAFSLRNPGLYLAILLVLIGFAAWTFLFFIFPPSSSRPRGDAAQHVDEADVE